jgi:hypothetical protein
MYLRNVNMLIYQTLGCHIPEIWKSHVLSNITCSNTVGSDCNANFRKHQILMWLRGANFIDYFLKWMNISFCMSFVEIQMSTCPNYTVPQSDRPLREINPCIYTPLSVLYIYTHTIWLCLVKMRLTQWSPKCVPRIPRNPRRVPRGSVNTF